MNIDSFLALAGFALVSSITPGPNNLMLMASGANFGMRRTLPHMLGISLGHLFMLVMVGLGLVELFEAVPLIYTAMMVLCVVYLLYLAWKIANAAPPQDGAETGKPLTFLQAAAFQWVNPKAWFMALSAVTLYAFSQSTAGIILTGIVFSSVNFPSILVWAGLGTGLRRWLTSPAKLRAFNWTMAACLVATLYFILPVG